MIKVTLIKYETSNCVKSQLTGDCWLNVIYSYVIRIGTITTHINMASCFTILTQIFPVYTFIYNYIDVILQLHYNYICKENMRSYCDPCQHKRFKFGGVHIMGEKGVYIIAGVFSLGLYYNVAFLSKIMIEKSQPGP